jgi:hydrogenase maturation protease
MKKSAVRSPESGVRRRNSKLETRKSKIESLKTTEIVPTFDFRFSNFGSRTPDSGPRTLIVGYGNPLRSDDGFGWHAGRLLAQALAGQDAEVITCHQLTPELAEPLSQSSRAVFIDADAQGTPGEIHRRSVCPQIPASSAFTHSCTPSGLLASAERLYGHRPQAVIVTVSAQSFAFGDALSPAVSAALPEVVEQVCREVRRKRKSEVRGPESGNRNSKIENRSSGRSRSI